jgi:KDO2-lipid IV(A) lauroyltransferase
VFIRQLADYSVYFFVRLLICATQAFSLETCQAASDRIGWLCWHVLKFRRGVIEENLRHAFPEKTSTERDLMALAMWRHLLLMIMEIAHAPRKIRPTNWRNYASLPNSKEMLQRLIDDRPMVLISGHHGNFEMGGYLLAMHGFPTYSVARVLDNPYLNRFINRFRGLTGQYMLPKEGSGKQIALLLERGGTLVLLGDQHAGKAACWVDFFGRPASTHKAVAVFTLSGKAPTAVTAAVRRAGPLTIEMVVEDIIDPEDEQFDQGTIPQMTQWYTERLESLIRRNPEQYWWVHRRWKGQPTDRRTLRRQRKAQRAA